MERFKVEIGRMKGALKCMRIFGFMHGVNNLELRKRLNEHVPKTMEEMMITTTAFIRGKAAATGKKKGHTSWRTQAPSKACFKSESTLSHQGKDGGLASLLPYKNTQRNPHDRSRKLKKQIEELVRAGKLSHLIKEIKQRRDQPKVGKKEVPAKDNSGTEGPLVIEAEIGGHMIHHLYVGGDHYTRAWMNFMIVRSLSPYNGIIGRPRIREIQAVPSTAHKMLKFPVDGGIVTIRSTILISVECATVVTSSKIPKEARVYHENFKIAPHLNFPDQEVAIGGTLSTKGRTELCSLLKENLDIFAWQPSDMTGVPRSIAEQLDPVLCEVMVIKTPEPCICLVYENSKN
ncbi:hypothetical protein Tco_0755280 [Tanacetum coccineum]